MSNFKRWFVLAEEEMPEDLMLQNAVAASKEIKELIAREAAGGRENPKLFIHWVGDVIYRKVITNKSAVKPGVDLYGRFSDQFNQLLHGVKMPPNVKPALDGTGFSNWHQFDLNDTRKFDSKAELGSGWNLSYKQYFTFKPPVPLEENPELVWQTIQRFVSTLPSIASGLTQIGLKYQDFIKFKLSNDLTEFLNHPDSLVVYHQKNDPKEIAEIQTLVKGILQSSGISTANRKYRSESGFDIKNSLNTLRPDLLKDKDHSHGSIVASAVAAEISKNPRGFATMPDDQLAQFILQSIQKYNKFSPADMAGLFNIKTATPAAAPTAAPAGTSSSGGAVSAPPDPTAATRRLTLSGGRRPITMGTPTKIGQAVLKGFGFNGFQHVGEEAFGFDKDETGWHINARTGAANAVLLNGKPVTGRTRVKAGDTIAVGRPEKNVVLGQLGFE